MYINKGIIDEKIDHSVISYWENKPEKNERTVKIKQNRITMALPGIEPGFHPRQRYVHIIIHPIKGETISITTISGIYSRAKSPCSII